LSIEQAAGITGKFEYAANAVRSALMNALTSNTRVDSVDLRGVRVTLKGRKISESGADKRTNKVYIQRTAHQDGSFSTMTLPKVHGLCRHCTAKHPELSACLANPGPMLLSGFLMPEIQRSRVRQAP
jgi:hypothetical protein